MAIKVLSLLENGYIYHLRLLIYVIDKEWLVLSRFRREHELT